MYEKVGIDCLTEFYEEKFAYKRSFDFTNNPLDYFDINNFKFLWIFSKVKEGSKVLDFGCGSGTLACLKKKNCEITGIDISQTALQIAKNYNSYDHVFAGDIFSFNHQHGYFDFIVSLDVFGHIPFDEKDRVIKKLKEFLKPGGVMLHGIECGNVDYEAMSKEQLENFVKIDGHVGIENKIENINRFNKFFKFVSGEVRFDIVNSLEEYIKQAEQYGQVYNEVMLSYLKSLTSSERKVFNVANGIALINMENLGVPSFDDSGGFLLLEASDNLLVKNNMAIPEISTTSPTAKNQNFYLKGWYDEEISGRGAFRWCAKKAYLQFPHLLHNKVSFSVFSYYPQIRNKCVEVFFLDSKNQKVLKRVALDSPEPQKVEMEITSDDFVLEIFVDTTWVPRLLLDDNVDIRELGIGLENLKIT